jgi:hypothetical protein
MSKICKGPLCGGKPTPLERFSIGNNICKKCNSEKHKRSIAKNGRNVLRVCAALKAGKTCVNCGEDDVELLEFAHIDRQTKSFKLGGVGKGAKKLTEEAKKCKLLCIWCHRLETWQENNALLKTIDDYKYTEDEDKFDATSATSRACKGIICNGKSRDISKFYTSKTHGKYKQCKNCFNYANLLRQRKVADFVNSKKLEIGKCNFCNVRVTDDNYRCFDFDHLPNETKIASISNLTRSATSTQKIIDEIKKCQLLCCKCHRKKSKIDVRGENFCYPTRPPSNM